MLVVLNLESEGYVSSVYASYCQRVVSSSQFSQFLYVQLLYNNHSNYYRHLFVGYVKLEVMLLVYLALLMDTV